MPCTALLPSLLRLSGASASELRAVLLLAVSRPEWLHVGLFTELRPAEDLLARALLVVAAQLAALWVAGAPWLLTVAAGGILALVTLAFLSRYPGRVRAVLLQRAAVIREHQAARLAEARARAGTRPRGRARLRGES